MKCYLSAVCLQFYLFTFYKRPAPPHLPPTSLAGAALPQLGHNLAAAAAAADYASWLCGRAGPLGMPAAGNPAAAAAGYLPLPANLLAARLSK